MIAQRQAQWESLRRTTFDVVILGGGVSGTCLFHHLCAAGYRVLLLDKGDFGSATSQSSAMMMIWGGLLYLKDLKLPTVWRLCGARDRLVREKSEWVQPQLFRYLVGNNGQRGSLLINAALSAYWMLGRCQGARPRRDPQFEIPFLKREIFRDSFLYQEAVLDSSDTRFALHWILSHQSPESFALNYCSAAGGSFKQDAGYWSIDLQDHLMGGRSETRTRMVVNCAGPWTDEVNNQFGIQSPFKHVLSKGVFLGMKRFSDHEEPLIIDIGKEGDCMSLIPWGPVSLWGPTETCEDKLSEALAVKPADVASLLRELNALVPRAKSVADIVSIRHGVRALVVNKDDAPSASSLSLSRKSQIHADSTSPWLAVYGGKLTDCVRMAKALLAKISERLGPAQTQTTEPRNLRAETPQAGFPGMPTPVPSVRWCVEREMCWTLEDYLRRRTNIAQWIPRGGLGKNNENRKTLLRLAEDLPPLVAHHAEKAVRLYELKIIEQLDQLLAAC